MLKKLVALILLLGLALPHSCGVRPVLGAWEGVGTAIMFGIPVLVTIGYALHQLSPGIAQFHESRGAALHGFFRAVCLVLLGVYVGGALSDDAEPRSRIATAVSFVVASALLMWQQGRGTKAQRLPLLLLTIVGVAAVFAFVSWVGGGLQYGGWVFTAGWLLAVGVEADGLRGAAKVEHGG
ncbi:MAG TPA: hypothetical protein VGQ18_09110 [Gemmatimonadales bacterium]|jgi:hypothetical protein|nr:hypothetical protein [Gemmatimonadales bacterium]